MYIYNIIPVIDPAQPIRLLKEPLPPHIRHFPSRIAFLFISFSENRQIATLLL